MPNWCSNQLKITGSTETLVQLKDVIEQNKGLLEAIRPIPEALKETVKGTGEESQTVFVDGCNNWYDWSVKHWGTKWDVDTEGLEYVDNGDGTATIEGWFESAWAPPLEAFDTLSQDWDSCYVELLYHEPGMAFVGCWDSEGGDDYYEYGDAEGADAVSETIPEYLDEAFGITDDIRMWDEENADEKETA